MRQKGRKMVKGEKEKHNIDKKVEKGGTEKLKINMKESEKGEKENLKIDKKKVEKGGKENLKINKKETGKRRKGGTKN